MLTLLALWVLFSVPMAAIPAACLAWSERDARRYDPIYVQTREEAIAAYKRDGADSRVIWKPEEE